MRYNFFSTKDACKTPRDFAALEMNEAGASCLLERRFRCEL